MNRYDIGDILVYINSFYHPTQTKLVGMIVSIVPGIKVKWCGLGAPEVIAGDDLRRYHIQKVKHNENRTTENAWHTY